MVHCVSAHTLSCEGPYQLRVTFYNYKGTFSIILMAIISTAYYFVMVDIVTYGPDMMVE